jgi:hypothetical protein
MHSCLASTLHVELVYLQQSLPINGSDLKYFFFMLNPVQSVSPEEGRGD